MDKFVAPDTGVVVFFGSENDLGYDPGAVGDAAAEAINAAKTLAPAAKIIVVGPPSHSATPDQGLLDITEHLKSAAQETDAEFVDTIAEGWISKDVVDLIGPDGDHPTVAGQYYLSEQITTAIEMAHPPVLCACHQPAGTPSKSRGGSGVPAPPRVPPKEQALSHPPQNQPPENKSGP